VNLTPRERMDLARAVTLHTGLPAPKNEADLSSVLNPVERTVDDILRVREAGQ
jgi:hypothetical protein